ncbi:hypothetical protein Q8W71_02465 [Methylobacterium sp. NEAU 140]|uniref:hypothetical protein n=1 Tax=Methylobacterium sp. NEAU 140 TaxID=3064945 RepID=UPI002735FB01|nr:hypothetical protein [Methylobacterium sp. NEAU 140]MDP4021473.1 hypothetical protein [Methylobacterium sp. NEAU 140]
MHAPQHASMPVLNRLALLGLLTLGLAACDDKKAENNTPTKPSATQTEPQTDQAAPPTQRPAQKQP